MKNLLLALTVLLSTSLYGQYYSSNSEFLPDGTGFVNGYYIGPGADLTGADLSGAIIWGADLTGADLSGAVLSPPEQESFSGTIISSTTILPTGYDLDWFSSQAAMVPPQQGYTIETYSSTDLLNWTLIGSESFQTIGDILSLKTVYSDTSNTLESHYSVDSTNWSLIKSEAVNSIENNLFFKSQVTPQ